MKKSYYNGYTGIVEDKDSLFGTVKAELVISSFGIKLIKAGLHPRRKVILFDDLRKLDRVSVEDDLREMHLSHWAVEVYREGESGILMVFLEKPRGLMPKIFVKTKTMGLLKLYDTEQVEAGILSQVVSGLTAEMYWSDLHN